MHGGGGSEELYKKVRRPNDTIHTYFSLPCKNLYIQQYKLSGVFESFLLYLFEDGRSERRTL